jgi:hypothetical protein
MTLVNSNVMKTYFFLATALFAGVVTAQDEPVEYGGTCSVASLEVMFALKLKLEFRKKNSSETSCFSGIRMPLLYVKSSLAPLVAPLVETLALACHSTSPFFTPSTSRSLFSHALLRSDD